MNIIEQLIKTIREFDEYEDSTDEPEFEQQELPPSPKDLPLEDQQALYGDITKVEQISDPWLDDHIDCVVVRVYVDGRQIDTTLMWCGPEIIRALKYADESPRAMADVLSELRNHLEYYKHPGLFAEV